MPKRSYGYTERIVPSVLESTTANSLSFFLHERSCYLERMKQVDDKLSNNKQERENMNNMKPDHNLKLEISQSLHTVLY